MIAIADAELQRLFAEMERTKYSTEGYKTDRENFIAALNAQLTERRKFSEWATDSRTVALMKRCDAFEDAYRQSKERTP